MSDVEMIRGVGVDAGFGGGRDVDDEELENELAIDPTFIVDRSIVSFDILDPAAFSSAIVAGGGIDGVLFGSCGGGCCSGTDASDSALRQKDTVNGVISVMHSSKRKLLLSVDWFVDRRLVDLKDNKKNQFS
jgi:hypothetical protein